MVGAFDAWCNDARVSRRRVLTCAPPRSSAVLINLYQVPGSGFLPRVFVLFCFSSLFSYFSRFLSMFVGSCFCFFCQVCHHWSNEQLHAGWEEKHEPSRCYRGPTHLNREGACLRTCERVLHVVPVFPPVDPPARPVSLTTDVRAGSSNILLTLLETAVPFWGQNTWNLSGLSPQRDCGSTRVNGERTQAVLRTGDHNCTNRVKCCYQ